MLSEGQTEHLNAGSDARLDGTGDVPGLPVRHERRRYKRQAECAGACDRAGRGVILQRFRRSRLGEVHRLVVCELAFADDLLGVPGVADAGDLALANLLLKTAEHLLVLVFRDLELHRRAVFCEVAILMAARVEACLEGTACRLVVLGLDQNAVDASVGAVLRVVPPQNHGLVALEPVDDVVRLLCKLSMARGVVDRGPLLDEDLPVAVDGRRRRDSRGFDRRIVHHGKLAVDAGGAVILKAAERLAAGYELAPAPFVDGERKVAFTVGGEGAGFEIRPLEVEEAGLPLFLPRDSERVGVRLDVDALFGHGDAAGPEVELGIGPDNGLFPRYREG